MPSQPTEMPIKSSHLQQQATFILKANSNKYVLNYSTSFKDITMNDGWIMVGKRKTYGVFESQNGFITSYYVIPQHHLIIM